MGVPIPGVTVIAVPANGGIAKGTLSRPDGTYEVDGIAEGAYFVDFDLTGFDLVRRNDVRATTKAPAHADAVLDISAICECVTVTPKQPLRERVGQVLSASGQPLPNAVLRVDRPPFEFALADSEGRFAIRVPLDGSMPLTVSESGFQSATQQVTGAVEGSVVFSLVTADGASLPDSQRLRKPCCPGEFFTQGG